MKKARFGWQQCNLLNGLSWPRGWDSGSDGGDAAITAMALVGE